MRVRMRARESNTEAPISEGMARGQVVVEVGNKQPGKAALAWWLGRGT